jgi:light-regulated signal transduction histidine kinase (bacteriophytochrome)
MLSHNPAVLEDGVIALRSALAEKSRELERQTATAVSLAREVESARAQLQHVNDVLEEHTEELERSNHELEQFAYVASHDLQEPLRAISGCVQILEKRYAGQIDSSGTELIAHAVAGVARLHELIEALLVYSRVGRRGHEAAPVSSQLALTAALEQLESAIAETGAVVVVPAELPTVLAEHSQLVQLLQNLVGNAIKYRSAATPRIEITAQRQNDKWLFIVADNGLGIEAEYFHRVFAIFQRLHTRDEYPGTGIGLALCRRIVEQAGGSIWIKSEIGKGSRFFFTLPEVAAA